MKTTREAWKELEDWRKAFREREKSEFDKLPMEQIDCEYCSIFFYYLSDYVAHKDLKHSLILGDKRIKRNPQTRLDNLEGIF